MSATVQVLSEMTRWWVMRAAHCILYVCISLDLDMQAPLRSFATRPGQALADMWTRRATPQVRAGPKSGKTLTRWSPGPKPVPQAQARRQRLGRRASGTMPDKTHAGSWTECTVLRIGSAKNGVPGSSQNVSDALCLSQA